MNPMLLDYLMSIYGQPQQPSSMLGHQNPFMRLVQTPLTPQSSVMSQMSPMTQRPRLPAPPPPSQDIEEGAALADTMTRGQNPYAVFKKPELSESQQNRAYGKGIMKFFANMADNSRDYGEGFAGKLARANASLLPAVETYHGEQDKMDSQNLKEYLYGKHFEEQQEDRNLKKQEHQDKKTMQEAMLAETKRYHDLQTNRKPNIYEQIKQKEWEAIAKARENNETSLYELEPGARAAHQKNMPLLLKEAHANKESIRSLNGMREVFDANPNIGTSYARYVTHLDKRKKGDSGQYINWLISNKLIDKKDLTAIQLLDKYTADLALNVVNGYPGKTATDILKKIIQDSLVNGSLTHEGFIKIYNANIGKAERNIKKAQSHYKALRRGVVPSIDEEEEEPKQHEEEEQTQRADNSPQTTEDKLKLAQEMFAAIKQLKNGG